MFRDPHKIKRHSSQRLFRQPRQRGYYVFLVLLALLIAAIPLLVSWQFNTLQLAALQVVGFAPTATPFASERAQRGQLLFESGDIRSAALFYEQAVRQQPENVNYLYEYGRTLLELDRTDEALPLAEQIIQLAPADPRGYALKASALMWSDPANAIPAAQAGEELGIPFAPLQAAMAVAYTNIGRYQEALQRADLAIRIDPLDASARRAYSYPLIYTGRYNEAIAQLEQAIAINANFAAPYFELASLYRSIQNEEMAVAIYFRVLEIEPNNARAYLRLCETYAAVGQFQIAEGYCDTALDIDPDYASAHRMRGQLRYSRRNYEGAIEEFQECLRLGSDEIECYYLRGLAHYALGDCDVAWEVLNEALARVEPNRTQVVQAINIGLENITIRCAGYQGRTLPTPIPPTPIPPTPIGGT
ncbi:MAG: tetratricopeptide repeat protein [Anaerolineae bacterium]|jgi:tetratricopeptide (TPR) repeat protein|nr:tetratricopeptide repeat protein [Anaerolineae bacterium]